MHLRTLLLTALLLTAGIPAAMAQEPGSEAPPVTPGEPFLTDPEDDVVFLIAEDQSAPAGDVGPADLTSLTISETDDEIIFTVTVKDTEETGGGMTPDAARLDVRFRHGDVFYDVGTGIGQQGNSFAELRRIQFGFEQFVAILDHTYDPATATFQVTTPRHLLYDLNGAPAQTGRQLEDLHMDAHVHATGLFIPNGDGTLFQPLGIRDRMPDTEDAVYDVLLGGPRTQGVGLEVAAPFRATNGGAATFAYSLLVTSESEATYRVNASDAPEGWTLEHPGRIEVPPGAPFELVVLATTPDRHQHGGSEQFMVRLEEEGGPAWGEADLGVYFLDVPQPAGHHDQVWFHNFAGPLPSVNTGFLATIPGAVNFNTIQQSADGEAPVAGQTSPGSAEHTWTACLSPALQLGLDFDPTATGEAFIPITSQLPLQGSLRGELVWLPPAPPANNCSSLRTDGIVVATLTETDPIELADASGFTTTILSTPEGDRVPYQPNAHLALRLTLTLAAPMPASDLGPVWNPGGWMRLPLLEYADERPAGFVGEDVVLVTPVNATQQEAPPIEDDEESPGVGPLVVLGLVAAAAVTVRRRR
ncbi:MAG: hypothetical protein ACPGQL_10580 [Thermoplasmatota archaeon]